MKRYSHKKDTDSNSKTKRNYVHWFALLSYNELQRALGSIFVSETELACYALAHQCELTTM